MQDSKYKYMFPPKKGDIYPEGCEIFLPGVSSRWSSPINTNDVSDGSLLRDCWFMRVPLIKWVEMLEPVYNNTYWACCRDDGSRKYTIYQTIRENKIVFVTCKGEYFDTLNEAKNSY